MRLGHVNFNCGEEYGAKATGITLSEEQFHHIRHIIEKEGLQDRMTVKLMDYRDLKGESLTILRVLGCLNMSVRKIYMNILMSFSGI